MEVWIFRNGILGGRIRVGEVTSAAAGNPDFLADRFVMFEDRNVASTLSGLDRAHQSGRASSNNNDVKLHSPGLLSSAGSSKQTEEVNSSSATSGDPRSSVRLTTERR